MISTINSNTNRISGLASGLETEELVEQLTSTTRNKIAKAEQDKTILEWKKEDYRTVLSDLVEFNDTYFGSSSSSINIADSLNKLAAESSNTNYVTAVPGSNATSGNAFISDIQSLATSAKLESSSSVSPELSFTVDTSNLATLSGTSMDVTLDGTTKTIVFDAGTYTSSEDVATALSTLLEDAFGAGRINVSGADGNLSFSSGYSTLSIGNSDNEGVQALDILGFTSDDISSNRLNLNKTLADYSSIFGADATFDFTINDKQFSFENDTTLNNIISTINSSAANVKISYSSITDTFNIISKETGTGSSIDLADTTGTFLDTIMGGSGTFTAGTNAIVSLSTDGSTDESSMITITRNSNTFTLEGTTYTLNGMAEGTTKENVTIAIDRDIDDMIDKITGFVDAYNTLLGSINDKIYEDRDRDFLPLSDKEKENLSDDEIKKWTEKARSGWLKNDIYLNNIATQLRGFSLSEVKKLDSSGESINFILADIGITTSNYNENGKLSIDEDALRTALAEDATGVINLLTQESSIGFSMYNSTENYEQRNSESGLIWRLNDIIKTNISAIGRKGSLVTLVGNPDTNYTGTSTYNSKISSIKDTITKLTAKLEDEENRHWSKFTAMETALNALNAQSAWLTEQLSA